MQNRFVKDLQSIDEQIPGLLSQFLDVLLMSFAVVAAVASGVPQVLLALLVLLREYAWFNFCW